MERENAGEIIWESVLIWRYLPEVENELFENACRLSHAFSLDVFFKAPFELKFVLHVQHVSFKFVEKNFLGVVAIGILSVKFPSQVAKHCLSQDYVYSDDRSSSYLIKLTFLTWRFTLNSLKK